MLLVGWLVARRLRPLVCRAKSPSGNPPPERVHEVLPQALTAGRRVLIVGDLHGCYDELQDLLSKCGYRPGEDVLISVGDLVNKGPDSLAVLRFFAETGPLVRAVRGNHDEAALSNYRTLQAGQAPSSNRFAWLQQLDEALVCYMEQLPLTLRLPSHRVVVVHAGLVPGVPLHKQHILDMVSMRNCVAIQAGNSTGGSSADGSGSTGTVGTTAATEAAQAQARAAALEASGIPLSGSLSSLDMSDFELVASASLGNSRSSSSAGGSSSEAGDSRTADGSSSSSGGGGSGSSGITRRLKYGARMPTGKLCARSEGLDWRQALLAYAQLGGPRPSTGRAQRPPAAGVENVVPAQQQPRQQGQAGAAGPVRQPAGNSAAAADQQLAQARQPRLVGTDKHTLGVPWARAWSEFQQAAPERHALVTGGCEHAVFGHDARRLLQLERCATGLDGGCVYGNTLYCLLLPPIGHDGQVQLEQAGAPPDAQQIQLCGGLPAFIVDVHARQAYAPTS